MTCLNLTQTEINHLQIVSISFSKGLPLNNQEQEFTHQFLTKLINSVTPDLTLKPDPNFKLIIRNTACWENLIEQWQRLFSNLPGYDYVGISHVTTKEDTNLLAENIILSTTFAPSVIYNLQNTEGCEIRLKNDGSASFWFPNFEETKKFPDLFNFKGSWKEAFMLLIATLKKGWPMEEFPEELQQFLKK